jgi:hypothetical protein
MSSSYQTQETEKLQFNMQALKFSECKTKRDESLKYKESALIIAEKPRHLRMT